jgi:hypothetical protein
MATSHPVWHLAWHYRGLFEVIELSWLVPGCGRELNTVVAWSLISHGLFVIVAADIRRHNSVDIRQIFGGRQNFF